MRMIYKNMEIEFDTAIPNPNDLSVLLIKNKNDLEYVPPILIDGNCLSDFGKELFNEEKMEVQNDSRTDFDRDI